MRIYAVADIHGKPDRIALIRANLNEIKPGALVVAGDITNYANCKAVIEQFNRILSHWHVRRYVIFLIMVYQLNIFTLLY